MNTRLAQNGLAVWRLCLHTLILVTSMVEMSAAAPRNASLLGSAASLDKQNKQAERHDFTYLHESSQLKRFVRAGLLVRVNNDASFRLKDVSFPYIRPEVKLFIERLSRQYQRACGEQLVITSLTRTLSHQPRNASPRSVHPTGMALDLRRPTNANCRDWLENILLYLEEQSVLEATRERSPPHYHVAIFTEDYAEYVHRITKQRGEPDNSTISGRNYTVRPKDTVWRIARQHGTTPTVILQANKLPSSAIYPGQTLKIPGLRAVVQ